MPGSFKKVWKLVGKQWLRSHFTWLRGGDVFQVQNDPTAYMVVKDPTIDAKGLPKVVRVEAPIPDENKHHC